MAADVDKTTSEEERKIEESGLRTPASGSRFYRGVWTLFMLCAVPLVAYGVKYYQDTQLLKRHEESVRVLGAEGLFLFSSLDTDHDLYLSPEEFKPIAEKLTGISPPADVDEEVIQDPDGETLTLEAKMQPLLLDSMTKSKDGFLGVSHSSLSGLRSWKSPAVPSSSFLASQFRVFLPPKTKADVGDTWWVVPSELNIFTGYLPNNRYHPPTPKGKEVLIHSLLSLFHPRPFVKSRFAPQGAVACMRAKNDFYYDIVFRIHAEFQLNDVPNFPFWFTPGQFTGNIVLSKDASHVRHFHLYVPNDRSLNVDMEWLYGASESSNMEVDIGYLPQMELQSTGPSTPSIILDEEGNVIDRRDGSSEPIQFVFEEIHWTSEISREEAARHLEKRSRKLRQRRSSGRTLRETVLESSPILALLNQSFISSWSLVKELENMQADGQHPELSEKARLHLEKYSFPVEMMVALPNGTIVHHINANYFLDQTAMNPEEEGATVSFSSGFEDPSTSTYINFLKEGLQKAKEYTAQ
ncbi:Selenoprotein N [Oryzias melastigma]|uniref:Selenoprotein N n=1 Tax=Oryzias melastigma TaxID=30732 RepID=A0A834F8A0_ORYME|nr:Selenoprotein N [Oryzias melastigma]